MLPLRFASVLTRFEESGANLPDVNPSARRQTSRNRDHALAQLRSITTRTAVAASIATVGFGGLAAFTYSGTSDATTTLDTTVSSGSTNGTAADATTDDTTASGLQATPAPTATTRHTARVTSGGSGH
jgi:hypothetical protein